jgi:hypothetical protein
MAKLARFVALPMEKNRIVNYKKQRRLGYDVTPAPLPVQPDTAGERDRAATH